MSTEALLNTLKERLEPFNSDTSDINEIQDDILDKISQFNYIDNIKYIISLPEDKLDAFDENNIYINDIDEYKNIKGEVLQLKEEIRSIQKTDPNFEVQSNLEDVGIKSYKLRKKCMDASSTMIFNIFKKHNLTAESFIENLKETLDIVNEMKNEDEETPLQNNIDYDFKDKFIKALNKSNLI